MAGDYTRADIARMEKRLRGLETELRQTPERASLIKTEISNLKYELADARRKCKD